MEASTIMYVSYSEWNNRAKDSGPGNRRVARERWNGCRRKHPGERPESDYGGGRVALVVAGHDDAQALTYSGTSATGVDVTVNNTDSSSHTISIHFAIREADGTIVESTTETGISVGAGSTQTVTWTFSSEHAVDTFSKVEVTVEQTG